MSTNTKNLGLIKPDLDDEVHQTVADLSANFQKLDDVAELYGIAIPASGAWNIKQRVWNDVPVSGTHVGWVCVRSGQAAPQWASLRDYIFGDLVISAIDNGHIYKCIQGGTSGLVEPTFLVSAGGTVEDRKNSNPWQAATSYAINDIVVPAVSNGYFYVCEVAGTSGATEPIWGTVSRGTTTDNGITWKAYQIAIWQEFGVASLFKGFGIIA